MIIYQRRSIISLTIRKKNSTAGFTLSYQKKFGEFTFIRGVGLNNNEIKKNSKNHTYRYYAVETILVGQFCVHPCNGIPHQQSFFCGLPILNDQNTTL